MPYKPAPLPPNLRLDVTVNEVMAFRHESARTVFRKLTAGTYKSYKNGGRRLIVWQSVLDDRERSLSHGAQLPSRPITGKRRPGRPRKDHPENKAAAPAG
jgi:hypothetical protein